MMNNTYYELKRKHEKELNDFPIKFAFDDKQFKEAMEELGLTENDTDKVYGLTGGGIMRKTDSKAFDEMFKRHEKEMQEAIAADKTGNDFIFEMFDYELANHEYCITWDVSDTLDALGLTWEKVEADERLIHGLKKALLKQSA